ncbi:dickkopf-related protein 3a isoform X2 [Lampris incognitus]|uniref:dickkopf-related protein 3a isoform X2 n=1 Tax=Lampris incognitus TaxID=2546036 RepID=UPI0024B4E570|nr:dickkopf-related protein 3a isoform X2 [Lampris incognitus]
MLRWVLLVLALVTPVYGILPEIVDSGLNQILEDDSVRRQTELDNMTEEQGELPQTDNHSTRPTHPPSLDGKRSSEEEAGRPSHTAEEETSRTEETESRLGTTIIQSNENVIKHCVTDQDCQKGHFCLQEAQESKCRPCKALDVPCTQDVQCCDGQLCVWGQCSQNATKGEAGSICHHQEDCRPDLCCAFHKALLFPICSARPIERERCYAPSNHLMTLFSWGSERREPVDHCPCAGDLQCESLGRGSLCLQSQSSSEEDLTDSLYSEIDYIV